MITGMICEACIGIPAVHYTLLNHLFICLAYDGGPHETLPWPQSLQSSWSGICNWFALFLHRHSKLCPGYCSPSCDHSPASHINMLNRQLQRSWFLNYTCLTLALHRIPAYHTVCICILSHWMQCLTLLIDCVSHSCHCGRIISVTTGAPFVMFICSPGLGTSPHSPMLSLPPPDNGTFLMPRFPSINLSFFVPW